MLDSGLKVANDTIINEVQDYIDPYSEGIGRGKAPIGAKCTITTPETVSININAKINGADADEVKKNFIIKLQNYLDVVIKDRWEVENSYIVSYAVVGSILLNSIFEKNGSDYVDFLLNDSLDNITLIDNIPVIGEVILT